VLVTPEIDRRNRAVALTAAIATTCTAGLLGWFHPVLFVCLGFAPLAYWSLRRRIARRLAVMHRPFPPEWEGILLMRVVFFRALAEPERVRFRQMVQVFLDEVRITGIKTDVDETIRLLIAASAIIPIFGFRDWEYHQLGEVLVYPGSFDEKYETREGHEANILGLTGFGHLRGIMILSKPALIEGFDNPSGMQNVGIHEFTHLVEDEVAKRGLPPEVPIEAVRQWISYVARELRQPSENGAHVNPYAYTNEHEFFAVLSEYFFETPAVLKQKDPRLYQMLRDMFHQDPASLLGHLPRARKQIGKNAPCPCGSGMKYRDCCMQASAVG